MELLSMERALQSSSIMAITSRCESGYRWPSHSFKCLHSITTPLRMEEKGWPVYTPSLRAVLKMRQGDHAPKDSNNSQAWQVEPALLNALLSLREKPNFEDIVSTSNDSSQTFAHLSVLYGYISLLERLVEWRIDLTVTDTSGLTALHYAYLKEDRESIRILLSGGAPSSVEDRLGRRPRDVLPERSDLADFPGEEIGIGEGPPHIEHLKDHEIALGDQDARLEAEAQEHHSPEGIDLEALLDITYPQGARVALNPPFDFNSFSNMNAQMLRQQMASTADVNPPYDLGDSLPEHVPALVLPGHIPNTEIGSFRANEDAGSFVNTPGPMMGVDPPSTRANPPSWHDKAIAEGGETSTRNTPGRNGLDITTSLQKHSRPQAYEGDVGKLCDRLLGEGADINTVVLLRYLIFAEGVTVDALMAPTQTRGVSHARNGASRMWEMLLEKKEVIPGKELYRCLLCPVQNRGEYRYDRDAIRHFNKDHFGFSFPCEYW